MEVSSFSSLRKQGVCSRRSFQTSLQAPISNWFSTHKPLLYRHLRISTTLTHFNCSSSHTHFGENKLHPQTHQKILFPSCLYLNHDAVSRTPSLMEASHPPNTHTAQASQGESFGVILALHGCFQIMILFALHLWGTWYLVTCHWLPFLSLSLPIFLLCPSLMINTGIWLTAFLYSPSLATILGGSSEYVEDPSHIQIFTTPVAIKPLHFSDFSSFWTILTHNYKLQHLILWQHIPIFPTCSTLSCTFSHYPCILCPRALRSLGNFTVSQSYRFLHTPFFSWLALTEGDYVNILSTIFIFSHSLDTVRS